AQPRASQDGGRRGLDVLGVNNCRLQIIDCRLTNIICNLQSAICNLLYQNIGEARPEPLVAEMVLDEGDARRAVAPTERRDAQYLLAGDAAPALVRHDRGDGVAALDQRQRQRVDAPARAAAARREDI